MPHDRWRLFLPYVIDTYKYGKASITQEGLVAWYRLTPGTACATGNTTGNTASQLQIEFEPWQVAQDKIFYSALLTETATVTVTVGGVSILATWEKIPSGGIGIYHGSVAYGTFYGDVVVTISRGGSTIAQMHGEPITTTCTKGITGRQCGFDDRGCQRRTAPWCFAESHDLRAKVHPGYRQRQLPGPL